MKKSICLVKNNSKRLLTVLVVFLQACTTSSSFVVPDHLPDPARPRVTSAIAPEATQPDSSFVRSQRLPALGVSRWQSDDESRWDDLKIPEGKFDLNVESIPLGEFIHVALGDVLGLSFNMDSSIASRPETITLRISEPVNAKRLLGMVEQTIAAYDVGLVWNDGALHVLPASKLLKLSPVPIGQDGALTPQLGRVMTIIPMAYASPGEVLSFAKHFLKMGAGADVYTMTRLNALLVIGLPSSVERFKGVVSLVDRPAMTGRELHLIKAVYWRASEIVPLLKDALRLQGIAVAGAAGQPGVYVVPVPQLNAVMVSAPNDTTTRWVATWIEQLDTPEVAGESLRTYVYPVKHSTAKELGATVAKIIGGIATADSQVSQPGTPETSPKESSAPGNTGNSALRVVVDEAHNSLVFIGRAQDYQMAYQLLQQLDSPAKQVLLEVTIADVSLEASTQLGVEWAYRSYDALGNIDKLASTLGGLGLGSGGLTLALLDATDVQAEIHALAANGDAKILSSPKLLAVDNEEARIQVGTQISVVTGEIADASSSGTDAGVVRSFEYIDTGVILRFTPTVMDNGVVRLDVYQEVSAPGASNNNTPPIATRSVETTLVAESGQTVMLGGLITHNTSEQITKVPFLGDIPWLGKLFSNAQITDNSTEMIIMMTPHVIENRAQADELKESFRKQLDF